MMDFSQWQEQAQSLLQLVLGWLKSPQFYAQVAAIVRRMAGHPHC